MIIEMIKNNRQWTGFITDSKNGVYITANYGQINGSTNHKETQILGKHIGKSNETTPKEQAVLKLLSMARKKYDKGYKLTDPQQVHGADGFSREFAIFYPMLAQVSSDKLLSKMKLIYAQQKLDGIRCLAFYTSQKTRLQTRSGKEHIELIKIRSALTNLLTENPNIVLDGELYVHGDEWSFQRITSAVKKKQKDTEDLQYHIYDCKFKDSPELTFHQRYEKLQKLIKPIESYHIQLVETYLTETKNITTISHHHVKEGYEGSIFRNPEGLYLNNKRSNDLLKFKSFDDKEFKILGGKEEILTNGNSGVVYDVCDIKDEQIRFSVRPKGTMKQRNEAYNNLKNNIGQLLTVKYFGVSETGVPRFPVGLAVRAYE